MNTQGAVAELRRMFPLRWSMARGYRLPDDDPAQPYYITWTGAPRPDGEGWGSADFDERGVIRLFGHYSPVYISQFALTQYGLAQSGDEAARERFLAQASDLVARQRDDGAFPYTYAMPAYGASPGWISAMAQGEVASVLLRAYHATGEERYLEHGRLALEPLFRGVEYGGASFRRRNDCFFEEIAVPEACHILNGHLYAAFGLWEYVRFGFGDTRHAELHEAALDTLLRWLPQFDAAGWSCYDLAVDSTGRRHYVNLWYHHFHIAQLRVFGRMTQQDEFDRMAARWEDALDRLSVRTRVWQYYGRALVRGVARRLERRPPLRWTPLPATEH